MKNIKLRLFDDNKRKKAEKVASSERGKNGEIINNKKFY